MKTHHAHAPTPLELFIDHLQRDLDLESLTPLGLQNIRARVAATLPHLPAVVLEGQWLNMTGRAVSKAIDAAINADCDKADEFPVGSVAYNEELQRDFEAIEKQESAYLAGLTIGLTLAHALTGAAMTHTTDPRRAFTRLQDIAHQKYGKDETLDAGMAELQDAIPIAKRILVAERALDSCNDTLEAYIKQCEAEGPRDGDGAPEAYLARDAVYYVAVAVGLLLSEAM